MGFINVQSQATRNNTINTKEELKRRLRQEWNSVRQRESVKNLLALYLLEFVP